MTTTCSDERRREAVRAAGANGLDYLEVSDDQRTLTVFFLGKAPSDVRRGNVAITGGPGARPVQVVRDPLVHRQHEPDVDDCMEVEVDRPGDFSTYTLCLVEVDEEGRPTTRPMPGFDQRYDCLDFSFAVVCPSDLDCARPPEPPAELPAAPDIDYLAKDYASLRRLLLDRLSLVMPQWQERHIPDVGIMLVELLAYAGDYLSYHQDAVATEAYLATARQRISVRRHARLVDYMMHEGCNARALVCLATTVDQQLDLRTVQFLATRKIDAPAPSPMEIGDLPAGSVQVFEPVAGAGDDPRQVWARHSTIEFYTWQNRQCCLPVGATSATLKDAWDDTDAEPDDGPDAAAAVDPAGPADEPRARALHLAVGDLLVLEEVKGPRTGDPADADRSHRHPVRLTSVVSGIDPLGAEGGQPVVDVAWSDDDALPFPLTISALHEDDCVLIDGVSVARGNVVLADHGRTVGPEMIGEVDELARCRCCAAEQRPSDDHVTSRQLTGVLHDSPVTHYEPLPDKRLSAAGLVRQDPHQAVPAAWLHQNGPDAPEGGWDWLARPDLLGSAPGDRHFVVEVDNEGASHLRFGDGRCGHRPEAGTTFSARYRLGNGPTGNVGADAITHIVFTDSPDGQGGDRLLTVRNPLPAVGGQQPESIAAVKALAPTAFRSRLERAITTDDYAELALSENPGVQRAAAKLRWTGSWYEVLTTVDALGEERADADLLASVESSLRRYRRIGHDLVVAAADYVPLDIELTVCVLPGYLRGHVKAALLDTFGNRTLADGRLGYFHPDNLSFGDPVTVSGLTAAAQAVAGVESVEVTRLQRQHEPPLSELADGVLRLGPTEVARLDNDPSKPDNGVLALRLRGGR